MVDEDEKHITQLAFKEILKVNKHSGRFAVLVPRLRLDHISHVAMANPPFEVERLSV